MTTDPSKPQVLVVDDDPGMVRAVSRVLDRRCEVASFTSPLEALNAAGKLEPDVAIVDIRMPEMNGFEFMRALHGKIPGTDVILMTGDAEEPDANLIRAIDEGAFYFIQKPFDRRVLLTLVGRCLELRRLRKESLQHTHRLEKELEEARQFQQSLLPPSEQTLLGYSISARHVACNELAGDFYDYATGGNDSLALIVADVVGHGASAAMLTGLVKSAFRSGHADGFEPQAVVDRVKEAIRPFEAERFVTLLAARVNPRTHELSYVNAGHPPALIRRSDSELLYLDSTGPLISSALLDLPCRQATIQLEPKDFILVYTDGLIEAQGSEGQFGRDRLAELAKHEAPNASYVVDRMLDAVSEFCGSRPPQDDMTLLGMDVAG